LQQLGSVEGEKVPGRTVRGHKEREIVFKDPIDEILLIFEVVERLGSGNIKCTLLRRSRRLIAILKETVFAIKMADN
jgi:hypothetical protein